MLRAGSLTDPRNIVKMFEEDSVMQLAQAGAYVGPADVGEYMGFVNAETSPYLIASTLDAIAFEIIGYDEESEQCELIFMTKDSYTTNPVTTEREESFSTGLLSRTFLDYKGKFYTRFNIFYTKGFLDLVFADLLAGETTQSFICNDVLNGACSGFLDTTVDCTQALSLLPKAEGDNLYVDGNSLGCRGLHSAFAYTNPEFHCPHVALTETEDPKGRVRCQSSEFLPISDLVSAELIEQFDQFLEENGVILKLDML